MYASSGSIPTLSNTLVARPVGGVRPPQKARKLLHAATPAQQPSQRQLSDTSGALLRQVNPTRHQLSSMSSLNNKHLIPSFKNFPNNSKKLDASELSSATDYRHDQADPVQRPARTLPTLPDRSVERGLLAHNELETDGIPLERVKLSVRQTAAPALPDESFSLTGTPLPVASKPHLNQRC